MRAAGLLLKATDFLPLHLNNHLTLSLNDDVLLLDRLERGLVAERVEFATYRSQILTRGTGRLRSNRGHVVQRFAKSFQRFSGLAKFNGHLQHVADSERQELFGNIRPADIPVASIRSGWVLTGCRTRQQQDAGHKKH